MIIILQILEVLIVILTLTIFIIALMMGMPTSENHYGEAVSAEKAPEAISTAVASLPPEQMYELMKQMKTCIQVLSTIIHY